MSECQAVRARQSQTTKRRVAVEGTKRTEARSKEKQ
jgi:hypothetical protein